MATLDAAALRRALSDCIIGREIIVLEETSSSNDALLQTTTPETPEGLVVFAEHQTAGRGQRGHRWESARGKGLWFSILLRPAIDLSESAMLTSWAASTIADMLRRQFSLNVTVKPPNDVHVDGKKIAGVLVEMRAQQNAPHLAIAGIGINVNHGPDDFPGELRARATSLAIVLDRPVDRGQLVIALLRELDRTYKAALGL